MDLVKFEIGGEPYAAEIEAVREVVAAPRLEPPDSGMTFLAGWTNLRGLPVPVVDLRARFGMSGAAGGPLLIVEDPHGRPLALRVDAVHDISRGFALPVVGIPSYFTAGGDLLRGLIHDGPRLTVFLDPTRLLSSQETAALAARQTPG